MNTLIIKQLLGRLCGLCAVMLLLYSCAQVRTPTGGQRDETPPQLLVSIPAPMSTQFSGSQVLLKFDEYISLEGVKQQVIISPPIDPIPAIYLRKAKEIVIDFDEPLEENTTYTINFGESISDYNEGNVLRDNVFLFSTGDFIDSLSVSGMVSNAADDLPCSDCQVMLHKAGSDSSVFKQKPYYLGRTDKNGKFMLSNLKAGDYQLYALEDLDADLRYDVGEKVDLWPTVVSVSASDSLHYDLRVYREVDKELRIKEVDSDEHKQSVTVTFSQPVDELEISVIGSSPNPSQQLWWEDRDSLELWFDLLTTDEPINLRLVANQTLIDTINIKTDRRSRAYVNGMPSAVRKPKHQLDSLLILTQHPIAAVDESLISLTKDSIALPFSLLQSEAKSLRVEAEWEAGEKYNLLVLPKAIESSVATKNDTLDINFAIKEESSFAVLNLNLTDSVDYPRLLRLSPSKKGTKTIEKTLLSNSIQVAYIAPGDYSITIIHDLNANGKWDSGDLLTRLAPEPVHLHSDVIKLKANWEVDLILD